MKELYSVYNCRLISLFVICLAVLSASCSSTSGAEPDKRPKSFAEEQFGEVLPTADGGSYAISVEGNIWYLKGSEAVRVKEKEGALSQAQTSPPATDKERALWVLYQNTRYQNKKLSREVYELTPENYEREPEYP